MTENNANESIGLFELVKYIVHVGAVDLIDVCGVLFHAVGVQYKAISLNHDYNDYICVHAIVVASGSSRVFTLREPVTVEYPCVQNAQLLRVVNALNVLYDLRVTGHSPVVSELLETALGTMKYNARRLDARNVLDNA